MKERKGSKKALVLLCLLVLAAAVTGCGSSTETRPTATGVLLSASTPTAGLNTCATCHPQQTAGWMTSRHANAEGGLNSNGTPSLVFFGHVPVTDCTVCHDPLGDSNNVTLVSSLGSKDRPVVGCESCHGPGSLHANAGGIGPISLISNTSGTVLGSGPTVTVSGQFVMCTSCHALLDSSGTFTAPTVHDPTGSMFPNGNQYTITDTHFATAGTYSTNNTLLSPIPLTGYAMDYSSETVCTQCHDPHGSADINRDWAASGHGDRSAVPWYRYNWSLSNYQFCQRCHTTSGFKNYANANARHDTATISNIWNGLVSNVSSTDFKPQMLQCTGCHTNNSGALRNPGAYNAIYGYRTGTPSSASTGTQAIQAYGRFQYPNASSSNVCIPCHSGRNSGETIHLLNTAQAGTNAVVNFGALRAVTSHDMTAAGTVFRGLGYEYEGRGYDNPGSYRHNKIGTAAVPNTGRGGPCVGCHMYRTGDSANHLFTNVNTFVSLVSGTTTTTTVVSSEVCFQCHAGSSTSLGEIVEQEKEAFINAVAALQTQLTFKALNTGTNWLSRTPYYSFTDTDTTGNTTGKNNLGAYFNRSYLVNEAGAFVHNSKYAKRLLYDSIDWIDDNDMNFSVGTDAGCDMQQRNAVHVVPDRHAAISCRTA